MSVPYAHLPAALVLCGDVRVMNVRGTRAKAVGWSDGHIVATGSREDVERRVGPGARVHDVGAAAVLPGFVDAHHHPSIVALYGALVRLAPPTVVDVAGLQRALASASSGLRPGAWLVATGWDEALLQERREPTRDELDQAVPDRPLLALHYSCHRALANSRALELAGIDRNTPDPAGGLIGRGRGGVPNGLLIERGMSRVETLARASLVARDAEGFLERLAAHHRELAAAGITRVVDATVPGDLATLYHEAARRGLLTVPTVMMPVSTTGYLETPWDALDGPPTGEGDAEGPLLVGPLKLVFDGAPGCAMCIGWLQLAGVTLRTFALSLSLGSLDPLRTSLSVSPRLGRKVRTGIAIYGRDEARRIVAGAADRGFAVATHAIGNEAIDTALSAYEAAGAALGRAGRPRIEHATFLDRDLVRRIAAVGAAVVAQPHFVTLPAFGSAPRIPGLPSSPLRWLLDAGVAVAGSSDFPVAGFAPLDGVRGAVTRRTARGRVHEPEQCIDLEEALALYTRTAAEVAGAGAITGTLEPGKRADLVVLDGPLRDARDLERAAVRATVIGGRCAFGGFE